MKINQTFDCAMQRWLKLDLHPSLDRHTLSGNSVGMTRLEVTWLILHCKFFLIRAAWVTG